MNATEKRLMKEYQTVQKELLHSESSNIIALEPCSLSDLRSWKATIQGPGGSPFENTKWDLKIEVPINYPLEPPKIKFVVFSDAQIEKMRKEGDGDHRCYKMPHPNINFTTGEICLDILQKRWSPAWTLQSSVMAIVLLLTNPEPLSPLNIDLANLLKCGDQIAYDATIRYYAKRFTI